MAGRKTIRRMIASFSIVHALRESSVDAFDSDCPLSAHGVQARFVANSNPFRMSLLLLTNPIPDSLIWFTRSPVVFVVPEFYPSDFESSCLHLECEFESLASPFLQCRILPTVCRFLYPICACANHLAALVRGEYNEDAFSLHPRKDAKRSAHESTGFRIAKCARSGRQFIARRYKIAYRSIGESEAR